MKKRQGRRAGFSRLEAVALLGATGALAVAVIPAAAQGGLLDVFYRARENARRASCQSNLKQIMLGLIQYAQDYDEVLPRATSTARGDGTDFANAYGWAGALYPYLKNKQLFACPSERHANGETFSSRGFTDYWMNRAIAGKTLEQFASPTQTISLGDGDGGSANSNARYAIAGLPPNWAKTPRSPARRHILLRADGGNYAFLDGHVKCYAPGNISNAPIVKAGGNPTFSIR